MVKRQAEPPPFLVGCVLLGQRSPVGIATPHSWLSEWYLHALRHYHPSRQRAQCFQGSGSLKSLSQGDGSAMGCHDPGLTWHCSLAGRPPAPGSRRPHHPDHPGRNDKGHRGAVGSVWLGALGEPGCPWRHGEGAQDCQVLPVVAGRCVPGTALHPEVVSEGFQNAPGMFPAQRVVQEAGY